MCCIVQILWQCQDLIEQQYLYLSFRFLKKMEADSNKKKHLQVNLKKGDVGMAKRFSKKYYIPTSLP